ncbi:unnamed protein product [Anisakis simplex]|uniref:Protein phosphatase CheZ n=1 Tax=Anisakis simplex TaxID=6269 RepID=A0A0M3J2L6_ANISI|nr:unnamed protein product [Anisakis simplex]
MNKMMEEMAEDFRLAFDEELVKLHEATLPPLTTPPPVGVQPPEVPFPDPPSFCL